MRAVIWTDVAQFLLYLAGSVATLFLVLRHIPGGWSEVFQVAANHGNKLQLFDFSWNLATKYTFWSGLIGGTFLTMASHGVDQIIVQRLLAAKTQRDSRKALLASGVIVFVQFALFLMVGVLLFVYSQHTPLLATGERADRILPNFIVREAPAGVTGILLASILAVAMSNASGALNSLAASSVLDLNALRGRPIESGNFLKRSRRMTLVWGAVLVIFGLVKWGPVLEAGLTVASLPFGSLLGLFVLGTFDAKANAKGSLLGMITGLAAVLLVYQFTHIAFPWYVMIGACVTFAVGAALSRVRV